MITVEGLSFRYPQAERPVLQEVNFNIEPGELVLVIGPSGSGKSTLLRCLNGLVPHFHGGTYAGSVVVDGRNTREHQPRDLAGTAGMVFQDPESQIVVKGHTDSVGDESRNLRLSDDRARNVKNLMISQGVAEYRITSIGMGEQFPVSSNSTEAGRVQNRRVEIEIKANQSVEGGGY